MAIDWQVGRRYTGRMGTVYGSREAAQASYRTPARRTSLSAAARSAYAGALKQFEPGGAYGKGVEAALERGRKKAVAGGQQALVRAGLAGTTMMAAPGLRFEEEIAVPTRARVEETRAGRLSELYALLAGAEQRGYESMLDRGPGFQIAPRYQAPTDEAPTDVSPAVRPISPTRFLPSVSGRLASALQRITPPVGSPAALWKAGTWGQRREIPTEELLASTTYGWA